jgi:hypothetical protein
VHGTNRQVVLDIGDVCLDKHFAYKNYTRRFAHGLCRSARILRVGIGACGVDVRQDMGIGKEVAECISMDITALTRIARRSGAGLPEGMSIARLQAGAARIPTSSP